MGSEMCIRDSFISVCINYASHFEGSTLKDGTIDRIPHITFSITLQGVDVKRVQFPALFRRDCSPWPGSDVEHGRSSFTSGCVHAPTPICRCGNPLTLEF